MEPTLLPGDRLYVERPEPGFPPLRRGEIVVIEDPQEPTRWLVKRVARTPQDRGDAEGPPVPPGTLYLTGDNARGSRDSRTFGAVPIAHVIGIVRERYWPTARRTVFDEPHP